MDDDYEEFGDDVETLEECGIDLGEIVLVSTVQGPEIGMLMDTFDEGVWLKTTHKNTKIVAEVTNKQKAELLGEVEKFTTTELQNYARENGIKWTFNKKREFLVDFVFEDLLKDKVAKNKENAVEMLVKMNRPVSMFIPLRHVLRVVSYDEWAEEKALRETAADLVSLEVDKD